MSNPDLALEGERKRIISEIEAEGNKERKDEALRRFEVFNDRQDKYILAKLKEEFRENADDMRKVLSINISKRIIKEQASIYQREPDRHFGDASEKELIQLENLYRYACIDQKMSEANEYFKLYNDQVLMSVIPRGGIVEVRPMIPYNYDVIPDRKNPEKPFAVIMNVYDKYDELSAVNEPQFKSKLRGRNTGIEPDNINQKIADADDYKAMQKRYVVWTDDFNFVMNGKGQVVDIVDERDFINPLGRLPFVDISEAKSHEFFRRYGSNVIDFSIEFGVMMSDIANVSRLQSYAQAIVTAEKRPEGMKMGPMNALWLKSSKNPDVKDPTFQFVSPSPDLQGALNILETKLRIFLSAQGVDTNSVTGTLNAKSATSGIERLLNMVEKFEASKSDLSHFRKAEDEIFTLVRDWSNEFQGVKTEDGGLVPDLNNGVISENVSFEIQYKEPEIIQTREDLEASVKRRLDMGMMTKKRALMELDGLDEQMAEEMLAEVEEEKKANLESFRSATGGIIVGDKDEEQDSQPDDQP